MHTHSYYLPEEYIIYTHIYTQIYIYTHTFVPSASGVHYIYTHIYTEIYTHINIQIYSTH